MNGRSSDRAGWLMSGRVMHERLRPVRHRFVYPVFCIRCDLARLHELEGWWLGVDRLRPLSLRTRDYGACDGTDLLRWVRGQIVDAGLDLDGGAVWLQTFPRIFGYAFNPVSFWFCHDRDGNLRALLAEVRNTFGQRHSYLLKARDNGPIDAHTQLHCVKALHVSPFCDVEGHYVFGIHETEHRSSISIDYHDAQGLLIRTAISLGKHPLTRGHALRALMRQPLLTVGVILRIHWQALRLWFKKVPFYGSRPPSPHSRPTSINEESSP
ncbi:DUF1365 domain-containing protein [Paraburkholderia caribensis]|uniref:DUF1365 domain-containing protein n=1 Tax=Paraburkholderia caribensis TaxID=75105 RepID=UPI0007213BA0|nr:DUF1365 domain-containing protein [Paraburkholderia caribensis]ALP64482.1 cyclopropane fatty acid synthase [Paraburkholderia caribensis]AUT54376.1 DUF1365 domain-containing protein [Paraburkholderia caribensis]